MELIKPLITYSAIVGVPTADSSHRDQLMSIPTDRTTHPHDDLAINALKFKRLMCIDIAPKWGY